MTREVPPRMWLSRSAIEAGAKFLDKWQEQWNGEPFTHEYLAQGVLAASLNTAEIREDRRTRDSNGYFITSHNKKTWKMVTELAKHTGEPLYCRFVAMWPDGTSITFPWRPVQDDE